VDLLYRLNVVPIHVRRCASGGATSPVVTHFSDELTQRGRLPAKEFDAAAVRAAHGARLARQHPELKNASSGS